jgi:hypothetical protein
MRRIYDSKHLPGSLQNNTTHYNNIKDLVSWNLRV